MAHNDNPLNLFDSRPINAWKTEGENVLMEQPEFTALQVTVFVRTRPGESLPLQEFLNSVPFEAQIRKMSANGSSRP